MSNIAQSNEMPHKTKFYLDGKWTKLLKAFAKLFNLQHSVKCSYNGYSTSLEVEVYVKTQFYESVLDVFEEGKVAYVSNMRMYISQAEEYDVERLSRQILEGTFGEGRYIQSLKGGDCLLASTLQPVQKFYIYDLPRSLEELMIRLDLASIDWKNMKIEIGELK